MGEVLPRSTRVMLGKAAPAIPQDPGWLYEPKWDGFRALVFHDAAGLDVISRDGKALHRYLPELEGPLRAAVPEGSVLDGEVVVTSEEGLDFGSLLLRIHPARARIELLARTVPASFVAFDVLAARAGSVLERPAAQRRALLEDLLGMRPGLPQWRRRTQVTLTPQTTDPGQARRWFDELEGFGLDGVICKRAHEPYRPGERVMLKVKHVRTADCVVAGYRLSSSGEGVGSLLLGLYDEAGVLHYVGHTSSLKAAERRRLLSELRPLEGGGGFGGGRTPGGPSRWSAGRDTSWVPLQPLRVVEVSYDKLQGGRFRHATRLLRWRDDRDPRSCTFEQVR